MIVLASDHEPRAPYRVADHHFAACLAREGHRVLWVVSRGDAGTVARAWRAAGAVPSGPIPGVAEVRPFEPIPPGARWPLRAWRTDPDRAFPGLGRALRRDGWTRPDLLLLSSPSGSPLVDLLEPARVVLRVPRGAGGRPWTSAETRAAYDLARRADRVVSPVRSVVATWSAWGASAVRVANGADPSPHAGEPPPRPAEISGVAGPVVLFAGTLDERVDWALVATLADLRPRVTFVGAGPVVAKAGTGVPARPNLRLLGPVSPDRIPLFARHADLGLVPFVAGPVAEGCHPLLPYEMAAAGRETVSAPFPELRHMASEGAPVRVAEGAAGLARALDERIEARGAATERRARAFAATATWAGRLAEVRGE